MDDETNRLLRDLDEAIRRSQADGRLDDDERTELRGLLRRLEQALDEPEGEHEGVLEHLEAAAVRLDDRHPTIAGFIRSAANTLSGYGI